MNAQEGFLTPKSAFKEHCPSKHIHLLLHFFSFPFNGLLLTAKLVISSTLCLHTWCQCKFLIQKLDIWLENRSNIHTKLRFFNFWAKEKTNKSGDMMWSLTGACLTSTIPPVVFATMDVSQKQQNRSMKVKGWKCFTAFYCAAQHLMIINSPWVIDKWFAWMPSCVHDLRKSVLEPQEQDFRWFMRSTTPFFWYFPTGILELLRKIP